MKSKSEIALKALEILGKISLNSLNLFLVVVTSPYGVSMNQMQRRLREIERTEEKITNEFENIQKFHSLLNRLKEDGLIKKVEQRRHGNWIITPKGKRALPLLKKRHEKQLPSKKYEAEKQNEIVIVIFDIPEEQKNKRHWLREQLRNMGFKLLQKSVWLGHVQLPEEFVHDLRLLDLTNFVRIFSVSKAGSIEKLI